VDHDALVGTGSGGNVECADPTAVAALVYRTFAVDPATLLGGLVFCHLARFLVVAFDCSYVLVQGAGGDEAELAVLD
jgi:hypothetical protein